MKKSTGYKEMLRDRCPRTVNYALKWQKSKERWLDHAYTNFIKIYCDKKERNNATRIILGISKFYRNFDFDKSINWDNLTPEDKVYWERISSWVKWFQKQYMFIEKTYITSRETGKDEFDSKVEIINRYLSSLLPPNNMTEKEKEAKYKFVNNLVDFLVDCFEGRI